MKTKSDSTSHGIPASWALICLRIVIVMRATVLDASFKALEGRHLSGEQSHQFTTFVRFVIKFGPPPLFSFLCRGVHGRTLIQHLPLFWFIFNGRFLTSGVRLNYRKSCFDQQTQQKEVLITIKPIWNHKCFGLW